MLIRPIIRDIRRTTKAQILKLKYKRTLSRLRKKYGNQKIDVAFCVSEIAKWKCQSLYDRLAETDKYNPIIFICPTYMESLQEYSKIEPTLKEKIDFFRKKKMNVVGIWDKLENNCIISEELKPDIIFYQQPWDIPPIPSPFKMANRSLTFYIPYYLMNNFDINIEFGCKLHHEIFGYIVLNEQAAAIYESLLIKRHYAGKCLGLGHTMVDNLTTIVPSPKDKCVIYAPHFSIPIAGVDRILTYSSFLENGMLILQFAKQHPEIKWLFKPHPRLKSELINTGVWSEKEVNSYYKEWEKIGIICNTSDYVEYFQNSLAMITDCGSFLTEYSCMNKPLIRLYYHKENLPPNPILSKLYSTFYYAHNNTELTELLDKILCQKQDPHQNERHKEIVDLGLYQSDSSKRICNYLDSLLSRNNKRDN